MTVMVITFFALSSIAIKAGYIIPLAGLIGIGRVMAALSMNHRRATPAATAAAIRLVLRPAAWP
jgi:hypothetical protein